MLQLPLQAVDAEEIAPELPFNASIRSVSYNGFMNSDEQAIRDLVEAEPKMGSGARRESVDS